MEPFLKIFVVMLLSLPVMRCNLVIEKGTNPDGSTWTTWKQQYNKNYDPNEEQEKMNNYNQAQNSINQFNQQQQNYNLGHNEFSDQSDDEFQNGMMGLSSEMNCENSSAMYKPPEMTNIPDSMDYRDSGYVTRVRNQGSCGACWAFVAIASLEGQHKRKTGNLVELSEQNLIDCSYPQGNLQCSGGIMCKAFEYAQDTPGVATEESYPYVGDKGDGQCHYDQSKVGSPVGGYFQLPKGDEDALKKAVAQVGPVATAFDGSPTNFRYYKGGIFSDPTCNSEALSHAVTVVGYGTENNTDYWLVKNSWGSSWGDNGFGKIIRNYNNHCGIATRAVFPVLYKNDDGSPKLD